VRTDGDEGGIESTVTPGALEIIYATVMLDANADLAQPIDLAIQHIARQAVGRNAIAHHAAGRTACIMDVDFMTEACEVPGGGEAGRASADDQNTTSAGSRVERRQPDLRHGAIAEKTFHGVDRDRAIESFTIAR
jgi:hypothetical protein